MTQSQTGCKPCLAEGVHSEDAAGRAQGQDRHMSRGHGHGPGRMQSPARSILVVQPQGSPVCGSRTGSSISRQGCPSYRPSGQKRSQQQCRAGRLQSQVIQSHKVASSRSSGRQEREPRSACREPFPRLTGIYCREPFPPE